MSYDSPRPPFLTHDSELVTFPTFGTLRARNDELATGIRFIVSRSQGPNGRRIKKSDHSPTYSTSTITLPASELLCVSVIVTFWLPFFRSTRPVKVCTPLSVAVKA